MENDEWKRFETNLVNLYQHDANAELAEALIKEYSAHIYKNTPCSKELETWIEKRRSTLAKDNLNISNALGLQDKWSRSIIEIKYLDMNIYTWKYIFDGNSKIDAYKKTANLFSISYEQTRIGFERKNHDFGSRELCRFSFDIFTTLHKKTLSDEDIKIANKILDEELEIQMMKDLNHHRLKYVYK